MPQLSSSSHDLTLRDGRKLVIHDAGPTGAADELALLWHHGSPQTGALLDPLLSAAAERRIRVFSYARPSYGGSSPNRGRTVASAAADVEEAVDALGIDRFATMGASGGGPPALACAALLPGRVIAAVTLAGVAPYTDVFDWFAGMVSPGALRAALQGRKTRERYALTDEFDRNVFTAADWAALDEAWKSLGEDAGRAGADGSEGLVADDLSMASPWGFDPAQITVPVLVIQGGEDRMIPASHGEWLARTIPTAEYWLRPGDGHVSVLDAVPAAMDWLRDVALATSDG